MRRLFVALLVWLGSGLMPAPSNISAVTATDIGTLPASISQDVNFGGTTYTVWYKFTAIRAGVIGFFAIGDLVNYTVQLNVYDTSVVAYLGFSLVDDHCIQMPVAAGETYYFECVSSSGNVTPAILSIEAEDAPNLTVPVGSIAISDEFDGLPLALLSAADATPLKYVTGFANGEAGAVMTDGTLCHEDHVNDGVKIYRGLTLTHTVAFPRAPGVRPRVTSNRSTLFYVGNTGAGATAGFVRALTPSGTLGATWTLATDTQGMEALAVALDDSVLYYVNLSTNKPIQQWDLVNDVALANLVAGIANYLICPDLLVMADGSILAGYIRDTTANPSFMVKRYSAAGATLNTYNFNFASTLTVRMALALDDPATFWIKRHLSGGNVAFYNVRVSDGATLTTLTGAEFLHGVSGVSPLTLTPTRFGNATSCPFWITRPSPAPVLPTPGSQVDSSSPCCASACGCDHPGGDGSTPTGSTGPLPPPVSPNWYRHCLGGGEVPSAADVVEPEDWHVEVPPKEPHGWLTIVGQTDEADERWGLQPLSDRDRFVAGRLEEVGSIERRSSDKDGNYAPARMRLVANDDDGTFRERLGDPDRREVMHRESRYERSSYAARKAGLDPIPRMQGRIVDVQPGLDRKAVVELQDIVGSQFGVLDPQKTVGVPVGSEHPNLPDASKGRIYNILFGEKSDSTGGTDTSVGMMPVVDCGDGFVDTGDGATPDPEGRTFDESIVAPVDQAIVNESNTGGDIVRTTFGMVAAIVGGVIGNPSLGLVLDPNGDGAGGPAIPHTHRMVWEAAPAADEYIVWMFLVPGFHPINDPAADTNVRYKIISNVPTTPPFPPKGAGSPDSWDFYADFTSLTDGAQWGVQTVSPPQNLTLTVVGTPGTARWTYAVTALSLFGESSPCDPVLIINAPDVLDADNYVRASWLPPADNPSAVIGYRVLRSAA